MQTRSNKLIQSVDMSFEPENYAPKNSIVSI